MRSSLSPKQVARAIQVSESSVKRWCDRGVIPTHKTAGGHRRIPLSGLLQFLRERGQTLVRPEIVGLPAATGQTSRVIEQAAVQMTEALVAGDDQQCRQITFDLYLAEHNISTICDLVFKPAFDRIGHRWECGEAEVYQERRGCLIAVRIFHELQLLLPSPPADAPLALGGAFEGDQYSLGTTMVELVLRDSKWNAASVGSNLPFNTIAEAIKAHRPKLLWISCSHIRDESEFLSGYADLYDQFGLDVAFVVGGRCLVDSIRQRMKYAAYCDNMQHLEAFAQTLRGT